jgi:hypothetical protein
MQNSPVQKINLEAAAWGALFLWWGIRWLAVGWPNGVGLVGTGVILLGLNIARSLTGEPRRGSTTILGLLALSAGALLVVASMQGWSIELPLAPVLMIAFGGILLARELGRARRTEQPA